MVAVALSVMAGACGGGTNVHLTNPPTGASETTSGRTTARTVTPRGRSSAPSTGFALPASCTATPQLAPITPTPSWPNGFRILDALPSALSSQYPTVYGGLKTESATPGESQAEVNSHFVVFETVHDLALEMEASSAYGPPLSVTFQLTPRSWACLQDIQSNIGSVLSKQGSAGAPEVAGSTVYSWGLAVPYVVVGTTACTPGEVQALATWFGARWGQAVQLQTCGQVPTAGVGES